MSLTTDESYATVAETDQYWSDRNDTDWSEALTPAKEAALRKATEWIDTSFGWIGRVKESDQVLSWPRQKAYDNEGRLRDGVPQELKNAVSWLAKEALETELDPAADRGGDIKQVQAGSVAVEWNPGAATGKTFRHVRRMLKNIITDNRLRRG